jgi:hypothetical protein
MVSWISWVLKNPANGEGVRRENMEIWLAGVTHHMV